MQAYVEAFNAGDVQAMLSTFAIETYVERTDRLASIGRMTIFSTNNYDTYPMPNDYMRQLLIADRVGGLARYMTGQYMMYIWPEEGYGRYDDGAPLPLRGDEEATPRMKFFWAILLILLPIALIFSEGSMSNLQTVSIIAAFPIGIVIVLIIASFIKDAKQYLANDK